MTRPSEGCEVANETLRQKIGAIVDTHHQCHPSHTADKIMMLLEGLPDRWLLKALGKRHG